MGGYLHQKFKGFGVGGNIIEFLVWNWNLFRTACSEMSACFWESVGRIRLPSPIFAVYFQAAQRVLISLFNLNSPEFSMMLSVLPKTFQVNKQLQVPQICSFVSSLKWQETNPTWSVTRGVKGLVPQSVQRHFRLFVGRFVCIQQRMRNTKCGLFFAGWCH